MRVVQFSTFEHSGGAARSSKRLHDALRGAGIDSRMLVRYRDTEDPSVASVAGDRRDALLWGAIERRWIGRNRSELTNTWFSTGRPGTRDLAHPWIDEADVFHMHWVPGLLASRDIALLLARGKPVVWTLHDEWAFTGGCHFTAGCERWRTACTECPQLRHDPHELVPAVFADKRADLAPGQLTIVAPCRWLANRAANSTLLGGRTAEVIEYGIDLHAFTPADRAARRAELKAGDDELLILFAAHDAAERRKGFFVLAEALALCACPANLRLVTLGQRAGAAASIELPIPVTDCGMIFDDQKVAATFAACDLFVCPSFEDNSPNTIIEALACGTPVIGSSAGGIPELVSGQPFAATAPVGDARGLADLLGSMLARPAELRGHRAAARRLAEERFSLERYASSHAALYERLLCSTAR